MNEEADSAAKAAHTTADFIFGYHSITLPTWALRNGKWWIEGPFSAATQPSLKLIAHNLLPTATRRSMSDWQGPRFPPPYYL